MPLRLQPPHRPTTLHHPERAARKPVKGISLRQMLQNSMRLDIMNTKFVHENGAPKRKFETMATRGGQLRYAVLDCKTVTRIPGEKARYYQQQFKSVDPLYEGPLNKCPAVMAWCQCERFKFVYDFALFKKNASELRASLPMRPTFTNPSMKSGLCKHGLVSAKALIDHRL